jgi:hypothetical protein
VPVVLVQEWFLRAARTRLPAAERLSVRDLRMLKGIVLEGFPRRTFRFDIEMAAGDAGRLALKLTDEQGRIRYDASVAVDEAYPGVAMAPSAGIDPVPASVYGDGRLFHGPAFQTIESLGVFGAQGGGAVIGSTVDRSWPCGDWLTDPAALDGALQLARLWVAERGGGLSLPVRIGACHVARRARPGQTYVCRLQSRIVDAWRSQHDLELMLGDELAISLSGLEMYRTKDNAAPQLLATATA